MLVVATAGGQQHRRCGERVVVDQIEELLEQAGV
jgi:hypothetical protein